MSINWQKLYFTFIGQGYFYIVSRPWRRTSTSAGDIDTINIPVTLSLVSGRDQYDCTLFS